MVQNIKVKGMRTHVKPAFFTIGTIGATDLGYIRSMTLELSLPNATGCARKTLTRAIRFTAFASSDVDHPLVSSRTVVTIPGISSGSIVGI